MGLRNLPTDEARSVARLIENRPGQVSSMGLTAGGSVDFMLMAFSAGESVSEEEYFGDTLYHVVEGGCRRRGVARPPRGGCCWRGVHGARAHSACRRGP